MIEIDGSYGEGGGQILRTAIALSAVTLKPIRIVNIRAGRPRPGLKKQHIAGIELVGKIVGADIDGLSVGSTELTFCPTELRGGSYKYDVGTAGSIALVLQAIIPAAVLSPEPIELELRGGTDVAWSPPIDYMQNVFAPIISKMGPKLQITQIKRGHYPRGGGVVRCSIIPVKTLDPLEMTEFGNITGVGGISHCVRLPSHVAERQAKAARDTLGNIASRVDINVESYSRNEDSHLGPGSGIVLWAKSDAGCIIGADALGERGKRVEDVGIEAAKKLLDELSTGRAIDAHTGDMLVPYLALAAGVSRIGISRVSSHLETNIWATERILGADLVLTGEEGMQGELVVRGLGLSL